MRRIRKRGGSIGYRAGFSLLAQQIISDQFQMHLVEKLLLALSGIWAASMLIIVPVAYHMDDTIGMESIGTASAHTLLATLCGMDSVVACVLLVGTQYTVDYILLYGAPNRLIRSLNIYTKVAWTSATCVTLAVLVLAMRALWQRVCHNTTAVESTETYVGTSQTHHDPHHPPTGIPVFQTRGDLSSTA